MHDRMCSDFPASRSYDRHPAAEELALERVARAAPAAQYVDDLVARGRELATVGALPEPLATYPLDVVALRGHKEGATHRRRLASDVEGGEEALSGRRLEPAVISGAEHVAHVGARLTVRA